MARREYSEEFRRDAVKQVANKFGVARSTLLRHIAKQKRAS